MRAFNAQFEPSDLVRLLAPFLNGGGVERLAIAWPTGCATRYKNSGNELTHLWQTKGLAISECTKRTGFWAKQTGLCVQESLFWRESSCALIAGQANRFHAKSQSTQRSQSEERCPRLAGSADLQVGRCWPKGQRYAETRTLLSGEGISPLRFFAPRRLCVRCFGFLTRLR